LALKCIRSILIISCIIILGSTIIPTVNVQALTDPFDTVDLPGLDVFIKGIKNGQADQLRGLYIPNILAARVVQQPTGMYGFVSNSQNVLTQFGLASKFGSTGLLAHNDLAGQSFAYLHEGQEFRLVYGDGRTTTFVVSKVLQYQALQPNSTSSSFVDLENDSILSTAELFTTIYDRPGQVVLQTCINAQDNPTWGRLFIIAEPLTK
jgi:hypothetical protein